MLFNFVHFAAEKHGVWHHFSGSLAGLSIFRNVTLNEADVQCLSECREKLDFTAVDFMDDAMVCTFYFRCWLFL